MPSSMPGRHRLRFRIGVGLVVAAHVVILFAGFFAPYGYANQNRAFPLAPPVRLHLVDAQQRIHLRPFVYKLTHRPGTFNEYEEDRTATFPVRLFVADEKTSGWGIRSSRLHLFGIDAPAQIFLAGTDGYGRDEFSRLLFGGQISLFAGLLGAAISLSLGTLLGAFAGYLGAWVDDTIMAVCEIFLCVPWLYLLLAVRSLLPLHIEANAVFLLLIALLGLFGWPRPARLLRGVVLSAKKRDYVTAARGFGASNFYLLRRHILPSAAGVLVTQTALYVPQYVLAEVTLSFFGLGVSEPEPSWGNMLAALQQGYVLESCWWMFAPAAALIVMFLAYHQILSRHAPDAPQI